MKAIPFNPDTDSFLGLGEEPGYFGVFTRHEYEGAFPNGTRVIKVNSEPNDATKNGTKGTILGSIGHPDLNPMMMYFIEWDNKPRYAIGCAGQKVEKDESDEGL